MTELQLSRRIEGILKGFDLTEEIGALTPEQVRRYIDDIRALGPDSYRIVSAMLSDQRLRRLLVLAGEHATDFLEYAIREDSRTSPNGRHGSEGAIRILGEMGASHRLNAIMCDGQYPIQTRRSAAATLALCWQIDLLNRAILDGDATLRELATAGLASLMNQIGLHEKPGPKYEPVLELFERGLRDSSPAVRSTSLYYLSRCGRITQSMLTEAIHDPSAEVRKHGLGALFKIGVNKDTAALLAALVEDVSATISDDAIKGVSHHQNRSRIEPDALATALIDVLVIRTTGLPDSDFAPNQVAQALQASIDLSPPLRERTLSRLRDLAFEDEGHVQTRAVRVARRLGLADFSSLVREHSSKSPESARTILSLLGEYSGVDQVIDELAEVAPGDVQRTAALQTRLLQDYYQDALHQSKMSFQWAVMANVAAMVILLLTVLVLGVATFANANPPNILGVLTGVSSVLSEFVAAGLFWLYDRAERRRADSQSQLQQIQKWQLANSVCGSLEGELQAEMLAELVQQIAGLGTVTSPDKSL